MTLLIDADACPVTVLAAEAARAAGARVLIFCDTAHQIEIAGAETIVVGQGADAADLALANRAGPGDIVVTQDYGLAALCLARRARVLDQDGREYTAGNIDALLLSRHTARKIRRGGGRLKGPARRDRAVQNRQFLEALRRLLRPA